MMKCSNCGSELVGSAKFCPYCGEKVVFDDDEANVNENEDFVPEDELSNDAEVLENTNKESIDNTITNSDISDNSIEGSENSQTQSVEAEHQELIEKRKIHKKYTIIGVIAFIIVVAVALTGVFFLFLKDKGLTNASAPMVYTTDTDLVVLESLGASRDKTKTIKVSEDYAGYYRFSENYKYIVYSENKEGHDTDYDGIDDTTTFDVYCKKTFDADGEGMLVAKNVSNLGVVLGDIEKIIFEKNGDIYYSDINGNSTKIANDASFMGLTNDRKYAICTKYIEGEYDYETETNGPSSYELKFVDISSGDVIKVCDSASDYDIDYTEDKFYFIKNDKLYVSDVSGKEKSIDKDILDFVVASGKVYYTCLDKEYTYYDFVSDSYKDSDSQITEPYWEDYVPEYDDYQKQVYDDFWNEYTTQTDYDAYNKAYEKAQEKYESDQEKYNEACDRIELREELIEDSGLCTYSLHCFDGTESKKIAENICDEDVSNVYDITIPKSAEDNKDYESVSVQAYIFSKPLKDIKKIDITSIYDADDVGSYLSDTISSKKIVATSENVITINSKNDDEYCYSILFKDNNYLVFFNTSENEDYKSTIYSLPAKAQSFDEATVLLENVYGINWINSNMVTYVDFDGKSSTSTMEIDRQNINDVYPYCYMQQDGDDGFLYATDYDNKTHEATIYYYKNGKSTKIADDVVFDYGRVAKIDNKYLLLTDYDYDDYDGTLICVDGENQYELDSDVKSIDNGNFKTYYSYSTYAEY